MGWGVKPKTVLGYDADEVSSAFQKMVRRGEEIQAVAWGLELARTSKNYFTWAFNRAICILHEDVGYYDKERALYAAAFLERARSIRDRQESGWEQSFAAGIDHMCQADKTRVSGHLWCVVDKDLHEMAKELLTTDKLVTLTGRMRPGNERECLIVCLGLARRDKKTYHLVRAAITKAAQELTITNTRSYVGMCLDHMDYYRDKNNDNWEYCIANAVLAVCRAPDIKTDQKLVDDAFNALGHKLAIPDVALDMHTKRGKAMKRHWDHFFEHAATLIPDAQIDDPWEAEAVETWRHRKMDQKAAVAEKKQQEAATISESPPAGVAQEIEDDLPTLKTDDGEDF
jgi:hypothetical protein